MPGMPIVIGRAAARQTRLANQAARPIIASPAGNVTRWTAFKQLKGSKLAGMGHIPAGTSPSMNAAVSASQSSKVGTWMRNRPKWQKYTAGGVAGIVGAKAVFGGGQNNGPYYNGY